MELKCAAPAIRSSRRFYSVVFFSQSVAFLYICLLMKSEFCTVGVCFFSFSLAEAALCSHPSTYFKLNALCCFSVVPEDLL